MAATSDQKPLSIYIHWPFCLSKCPYCDFNSRVAESFEQEAWAAAYEKELAFYAAQLPAHTVKTIYFGGGTPSLMAASTVQRVLEKIAFLWDVDTAAEITLEANPTSVEAEKFHAFRMAGINRLSLGVQALRGDALKFLGRKHDVVEAKAALALAQKIFPRFSFDLIYARAGQTLVDWQAELEEALALGAKHMSLYQLTIEEGSIFYKRARNETLTADETQAAEMYQATNETMAAHGVPLYEISNYAAAGEESLHNLAYWHYDDYIGVGPGAHGRFVADGQRWATEDLRAPEAWLMQVARLEHGREICAEVTADEAKREALLMGLRLASGIDGAQWQKKFGAELADFFDVRRVAKLAAEGLLIFENGHLRATADGLQRLNAVLAYLQ